MYVIGFGSFGKLLWNVSSPVLNSAPLLVSGWGCNWDCLGMLCVSHKVTYHFSESMHQNAWREVSKHHPMLIVSLSIPFLHRKTWKPQNMCVGCVWPDSSFIRLTRVACKCFYLAFTMSSLVPVSLSRYTCISSLLSSSLFREDCDPLPSDGFQKSLLTLSFPRFPMLSRTCLTSIKGWAMLSATARYKCQPSLSQLISRAGEIFTLVRRGLTEICPNLILVYFFFLSLERFSPVSCLV